MKRLPEKLFALTRDGVGEDELQPVFDALIEAEERGARFVNVYDVAKGIVYITDDKAGADEHLGRARAAYESPFGLAYMDDDWIEREAMG